GADTVIGGNENGIGEARGLEVEQAAEAADLAIGTRPARRTDSRLDLLDEQVAGIDVDARVAIGQAVFSRLAHADLRWLPHANVPASHAGRNCMADGFMQGIAGKSAVFFLASLALPALFPAEA